MQFDSNFFYKKDNINCRGFHDPVSKTFTIKAGSCGELCKNPENIFFGMPDLIKKYEAAILSNISSAGNDVKYYINKDIRCNPMYNYDEFTIAASLMSGKLIIGNKVWKNNDGITVQKLKSNQTYSEEKNCFVDENIQRYEDATNKTYEILLKNKGEIINNLSLAYHLKKAIGSKNEDKFTVPRQIDKGMIRLGFLCEEEKGYDLVIPYYNYTVSDKTLANLFHYDTSGKPRVDKTKELQMSNTRSGQSSEKHKQPQFDCLLIMQYNPYLVCGVIPYYKVANYFTPSDGGWKLKRFPIENIQFIISPTESMPPIDINEEIQSKINRFVFLSQGGLFQELLDIMPKIVYNDPIEPW